MAYSTTGIAYLTLLFAVGYLIYRFFQYWEKEKDPVSKQSLCFVSLFGLFILSNTIAGLFFADNLLFLVGALKINVFIQTLALAAMAYHIIYIRFPKISPWLGFIPILILGLITTALTVFLQHNPLLEPSGAINWGFPSGPLAVAASLLRLSLFLATFIPLTIILLLQFKKSEDLFLKRKALGLSLALLFIIIGASFDFLLINIFHLDPIWRDMVFIVCSVVFLTTLILTLPRSSSKIWTKTPKLH